MSPRERPFFERLRRFEDVLREISEEFGGTHRLTAILEADPPRVVSIAVRRTANPSARATVYIPASDRSDSASAKGKAELRRRIEMAIQQQPNSQLTLDGIAGRPSSKK